MLLGIFEDVLDTEELLDPVNDDGWEVGIAIMHLENFDHDL